MDYRLSERMMVSACAAGILIVMLGNRRQSLTMSAVGAEKPAETKQVEAPAEAAEEKDE